MDQTGCEQRVRGAGLVAFPVAFAVPFPFAFAFPFAWAAVLLDGEMLWITAPSGDVLASFLCPSYKFGPVR